MVAKSWGLFPEELSALMQPYLFLLSVASDSEPTNQLRIT